MAWAIIEDGKVSRVLSAPRALTIQGTRLGQEIFSEWSADQLREKGIYPLRKLALDLWKYYHLTDRRLSIRDTEVIEEAEISEKSCDEIFRTKVAELRAKSKDVARGGVKFEGRIFATDMQSLTVLNAIVLGWLAGGDLPDGFKWSSKDGRAIHMTRKRLQKLLRILMVHMAQCKNTEAYHHGELQTLTEAGDLIGYELDIGWPETTAAPIGGWITSPAASTVNIPTPITAAMPRRQPRSVFAARRPVYRFPVPGISGSVMG